MKTLYLYRLQSTQEGTFGILANNGMFWNSLELPDRDNKPNLSCIPTGEYHVKLRYSPHFKKKLYHIQEVSKRSFILIHGANFAGDAKLGWQTHLQGCITLGKAIGRAKNKHGKMQRCVFRSRQAIREMNKLTKNEPFKLIISNI